MCKVLYDAGEGDRIMGTVEVLASKQCQVDSAAEGLRAVPVESLSTWFLGRWRARQTGFPALPAHPLDHWLRRELNQ